MFFVETSSGSPEEGGEAFPSPRGLVKHLFENGIKTHKSSFLGTQRPLAFSLDTNSQKQELQLLILSKNGPKNALKTLISKNDVDVNWQSEKGVSAMMCACLAGQTKLAKLLLGKQAKLDLQDDFGFNALHCAVWGGSADCMKLLLGKAPHLLSSCDCWGRTPLHVAALQGNADLFVKLTKKGASLAEKDLGGRGVAHWVALGKWSTENPLDKSSFQSVAAPDMEQATPLHYAAIARHVNDTVINNFVSLGFDPMSRDCEGLTALHWAATFGKSFSCQLLLKKFSSASVPQKSKGSLEDLIEEDDKCGVLETMQPLHIAAAVGSAQVAELLLGAGVEVDCRGYHGLSPLLLACRHGHDSCVSLLLSRGAEVNAKNTEEKTGLYMACEFGHVQIVKVLLEHSAKWDVVEKSTTNSAVHAAASAGHCEVLEALLAGGCSMDVQRESDQRTPLHLAAEGGHLFSCQVLIEKGGVQVNHTDGTMEGMSPLDLALLAGHSECSDYLIARGGKSAGGPVYRAVVTIQMAWRFYLHKRRSSVSRIWAVKVLQRAVRQWMRTKRMRKERAIRQIKRSQAAIVIQKAWWLYKSKVDMDNTCAALRAKLNKEMLATEQLVTELKDHTHNVQLPDFKGMRKKESTFATSASLLRAAVKSTSLMTPFPHDEFPLSGAKLLSRGSQKKALIAHKERKVVSLGDVLKGKDSDSPGERGGANINKNGSTLPFPKINPHGGLFAKEPPSSSSMLSESEVPKLPPLDLTRYSKQSPHKKDVLFDPAKFSIPHSAKNQASFKPPSVSDNSAALPLDLLALTSTKHQNTNAQPNEPFGPAVPSDQPQGEIKKKHKRKKPKKKKATEGADKIESLETAEGSNKNQENLLVNQAQRYGKLHEVLTILQNSPSPIVDETSQPAERNEQVRTALEEAVRLRAEAEQLHSSVDASTVDPTKDATDHSK